jgi:tetratricopeptide (TPR) repeat protein
MLDNTKATEQLCVVRRGIMRILALSATALALTVATSQAQDELAWNTCINKPAWLEALKACTTVIDSQSITTAQRAQAYLKRAEARFATKSLTKGDTLTRELNQAMDDITKSLELNPEDVNAYIARGRILEDIDLDRALADYTEAIRRDPKNAAAYSHRGRVQGAKGNLDRSLADYSDAIRYDPKHVYSYLMRGEVHAKKGNLDPAVDDFTKVIELEPPRGSAPIGSWRRERAFKWRAEAYEKKGDLDRALADAEGVIREANPGDPLLSNKRFEPQRLRIAAADAHAAKGSIASQTGDFDRAIAEFSKALDLHPDNTAAYAGRAFVHASKGNLDAALADASKAIVSNPKPRKLRESYALSPENLGEMHLLRAKLVEQQRDFKLALAEHEAAARLGVKVDLEKAIAEFSEAIRADPRKATGYFGRGLTYAKQGNLDRALEDLSRAIELDRKMTVANQVRAEVYEKKGDLARAVADHDAVLASLAKDDPAAGPLRRQRFGMAEKMTFALVKNGTEAFEKRDLDRAMADFSAGIALIDPGDSARSFANANAYYGRGLIHAERGNFDRALDDLSKALTFDVNLQRARATMADVYERQQRYKDAIEEYGQVVNAAVQGSLKWRNSSGQTVPEARDRLLDVVYMKKAEDAVKRSDFDGAINIFSQMRGLLNHRHRETDARWMYAVYQGIASATAAKGDIREALRYMDAAVQVTTDGKLGGLAIGNALVVRAELHEKNRNYEQALVDYEAALRAGTMPNADDIRARIERIRAQAK